MKPHAKRTAGKMILNLEHEKCMQERNSMHCVIIALAAGGRRVLKEVFRKTWEGSSSINLIRLHFRSINSQIWDLSGSTVWENILKLILKQIYGQPSLFSLRIIAEVQFSG